MDTNKRSRCKWCQNDPIYIKYHDDEWGVPVFDDTKLFELLILETFQSGISWLTVLKKRDNFKIAFDNYDISKISKYTDNKLNSLINNSGIIRNKLKIKSVKQNAIAFIKIQKEFKSFSKYLWKFVNGKPKKNHFNSIKELPSKTILSEKISRDLKLRGFKFVGPTIIYAYMQAIGMVNDHTTNCFKY